MEAPFDALYISISNTTAKAVGLSAIPTSSTNDLK